MLLIVKIFPCITSLSIRKQFLCESVDNDVIHRKVFTISNILVTFYIFKKKHVFGYYVGFWRIFKYKRKTSSCELLNVSFIKAESFEE